ncbi:MAG: hypothetical protein ACFB16_22595 [Phormidesmis sp.]
MKTLLRQQTAKLTYRQGLGYAQRQLYKKAIAAFSQAIAQGHPRPAQALLRRGISRIDIQDKEGAIADFDAVIHIERAELDLPTKQHTSACFLLSQAFFYKGKLHKQAAIPNSKVQTG